jgi:flavin-dependent dehydrogenase
MRREDPMIDQDYDALIVGARVAGATLAILLGGAGYRVLLVDRAAFPSATLSTHYFRGGRGVTVLKQVGVLDDVLARGCPPLTCQYNYANGCAEPVVNPAQSPGEVAYCLSVRRETLDYLLIERARRCPSITVLEHTRVTDVLRDHGRVVGARLVTLEGEREVWAGITVGADGRRSSIARAVAAPDEESDEACRAVYYCYLRGFPGPGGKAPDGPEFSRIEDEMAYVFPSDDGVACLALSVNLPTFRWMRHQPRERFVERIAAHRGLADRFAAATWEGRLLGCGPERNYVRVPVGPGWALVGDAGMHQDPWSGTGIDKATIHATFLAAPLAQWFAGNLSEHDALASYHARRNEDGLASYRQTVTLAKDLRQLSAG